MVDGSDGLPVVGQTWGPVVTRKGHLVFTHDRSIYNKAQYYWGYNHNKAAARDDGIIQYYWGKADDDTAVRDNSKVVAGDDAKAQYYWGHGHNKAAARDDGKIQYYWGKADDDTAARDYSKVVAGDDAKAQYYWGYVYGHNKVAAHDDAKLQYYWNKAGNKAAAHDDGKIQYYWGKAGNKAAAQKSVTNYVDILPNEVFSSKSSMEKYMVSKLTDDTSIIKIDPAALTGKYVKVLSSKPASRDSVKLVCHSYHMKSAFCHSLGNLEDNMVVKLMYSIVQNAEDGSVFPVLFFSHYSCDEDESCKWMTHVNEAVLVDRKVFE